MHFDAAVRMEHYIYLIEHVSRCLISIHIPSGKTKTEAYLPWRYRENKIGMLPLERRIFIYSPFIDHFLIYDCLNQQITTVKLQEAQADETGHYYSNILIDQEDLIVLPFKDREIRIYGIDGRLKFKDSQWSLAIARECNYNKKEFGNIRLDSACIAEKQLFFSLTYGDKNYLCKYQLNDEKHVCSIIFNSESIPIKGIYAYSDTILFRRMFADKTEIILIRLNSDEKETIIIDYRPMFRGDIYGDMHHLKTSLEKKILAIDGSDFRTYQTIYSLEQSDEYIANGIIFNVRKNEVLIPEIDYIRRYLIEKKVREIQKCSSYQEGYRSVFCEKCIYEEKYKLQDLTEYLTEILPVMIEKKSLKEDSRIGEFIWKAVR